MQIQIRENDIEKAKQTLNETIRVSTNIQKGLGHIKEINNAAKVSKQKKYFLMKDVNN